MTRHAAGFAFVAALLLATRASAADPDGSRYFFILFGGQSVPFRARTAHTWATYVKTVPQADGGVTVEYFTVSWLPADLDVKPLKLRTVAGHNWTLEETLALAATQHNRISVWGPYEIDEPRFAFAEEQRQRLESEVPRYRGSIRSI